MGTPVGDTGWGPRWSGLGGNGSRGFVGSANDGGSEPGAPGIGLGALGSFFMGGVLFLRGVLPGPWVHACALFLNPTQNSKHTE